MFIFITVENTEIRMGSNWNQKIASDRLTIPHGSKTPDIVMLTALWKFHTWRYYSLSALQTPLSSCWLINVWRRSCALRELRTKVGDMALLPSSARFDVQPTARTNCEASSANRVVTEQWRVIWVDIKQQQTLCAVSKHEHACQRRLWFCFVTRYAKHKTCLFTPSAISSWRSLSAK